MDTILIPFITGLTTGGISCFAIQGGLLTAISTKKRDVAYFLISKLISYSLLGFILGLIGTSIGIPIKFQAILQILIGLFMILISLKKYAISPPKKFFRIVRNQKTPIILGALTVLIPCGVTQMMILQSISSGSALSGFLILFFFILGTSPMFFLLGTTASELIKNKYFALVGSIVIFILGLISIKNGMTLMGYNFTKIASQKTGTTINIEVNNHGYTSDVNTLKIGKPVKLIINTKNVISCARSFVIPDLKYSVLLPQNGQVVYEFTPTKLGNLTYTCSMGMYSGKFDVVE